MNGAELIAEFIGKKCFEKVFLVTGGACAFIVDAIGRNVQTEYVCMQHEQAAAMAADAIWRTTGKLGVTVATSGPGATNLITGIACSWFDSIPSIHITGQVNQRESAQSLGVNVRQAGFQETDIVGICQSITKFSTIVKTTSELAHALSDGFLAATSGRMGPVLIDVPMDVQQAKCSDEDIRLALADREIQTKDLLPVLNFNFAEVLLSAKRPMFIFGAGLGFGGCSKIFQNWCEENDIPYCSSWGGLPFIDKGTSLYQGSLGVYGSRRANWAIQSADLIISLGSRLDNRQRTGNPNSFAPFAKIVAFDIDQEELKKYAGNQNYICVLFDLRFANKLIGNLDLPKDFFSEWATEVRTLNGQFAEGFDSSVGDGEINPYEIIQILQSQIAKDAIVVSDCGANLCWVYQSFRPSNVTLFTAGGNSPMGYALPAAIGAAISNPSKEIICIIGDGGFQMNIQELQTVINYQLKIKIVILNNQGYGIIKQFQDAYFESRYEATGNGYSLPDFGKVIAAYGLPYSRIQTKESFVKEFNREKTIVLDVILPTNALITPKVEVNRFIHDQFPYGSLETRPKTKFVYPNHPSELLG